MFTASQVLYGMRSMRTAATSVVIAAYRKEPAFSGDITWEMALVVTPFDGRPCQMLWDEDTIRYHISPQQAECGGSKWEIDCQQGAQYWGCPPVFLVGLGISNFTEEDIWNIVKDIPIADRSSPQKMYKDWVWDLLPALAHAEAIYARYGRPRDKLAHTEQPVTNMLGRPVARCKNGVFSWRF